MYSLPLNYIQKIRMVHKLLGATGKNSITKLHVKGCQMLLRCCVKFQLQITIILKLLDRKL